VRGRGRGKEAESEGKRRHMCADKIIIIITGFSPVLYEVPPCKVGRHISADDKQKMLDARYCLCMYIHIRTYVCMYVCVYIIETHNPTISRRCSIPGIQYILYI
jgi:hypothetical protein